MTHPKGLADFEKNMLEAFKKTEAGSKRALLAVAHKIINRSKELTPVDTGLLKANQFATATDNGARIDVKQNYAVVVHEDLGAYHKTGQAKFLETALNEHKEEVLTAIKNEVDL